MDYVVFRREYGLDNIRVPVIHSVTDDIGFGICIHYIMASIVVESRAYAVVIVAAESPRLVCIGLDVCEETAAGRNNWVGIIVKRDIEVLPG